MDIVIVESAAFTGRDYRLDKAANIAFGVSVCGRESLNNRDYPDAVRDRDKGIYERSQVFIDHSSGERKVKEWFGELRNVRTRVSDRKTIADHHYPRTSGFTAEYEERAEKFPRSLGFSHVAVCDVKRVAGRESITAIKAVHSVDLVARPATNVGLFESATQPTPPLSIPTTGKEFAERYWHHSPSGIPVDGAAFARRVKGELSTEELQAFLESIGVRPNLPADGKAFVERLKWPASGSTIPTDGKAFAEWLKRGR